MGIPLTIYPETLEPPLHKINIMAEGLRITGQFGKSIAVLLSNKIDNKFNEQK